jgi:hypothetical protein
MNEKQVDPQEGIKAELGARGILPKAKNQVPYKHSSPVQSRNSICSCGSGLKYKKCCGIRKTISEQGSIIELRRKKN